MQMLAKWPGRCPYCDRRFEVGVSQIRKTPVGTWVHADTCTGSRVRQFRRAQADAVCVACGGPIHQGDEIHVRAMRHLECPGGRLVPRGADGHLMPGT